MNTVSNAPSPIGSRAGISSGRNSSSPSSARGHAARREQPERAEHREHERAESGFRQDTSAHRAAPPCVRAATTADARTAPRSRSRGVAERRASSAVPARRTRQSGTITKLTNGTATRFESAPTSEASPKNQIVSGSSDSDITSWPTVSSRRNPTMPRRRSRQSIRNATPTNDSQKPADSTASGSTTRIATSASDSACGPRLARRLTRASTTPRSSAACARSAGCRRRARRRSRRRRAPPGSRAIVTGTRSVQRGNSQPRRRTSSAPSPPATPTWKPEIAIRCGTPLTRATCPVVVVEAARVADRECAHERGVVRRRRCAAIDFAREIVRAGRRCRIRASPMRVFAPSSRT